MTDSQGVSPALSSRVVTPAPHERTVEAGTRKGRQDESAEEGCPPDSPLVASVILAARIAAQAQGGQILASLTVRELCPGKGFLVADTGDVTLKGFEEPVRLFAVRWQEEDA